jgi:hypothetical protein
MPTKKPRSEKQRKVIRKQAATIIEEVERFEDLAAYAGVAIDLAPRNANLSSCPRSEDTQLGDYRSRCGYVPAPNTSPTRKTRYGLIGLHPVPKTPS